MFFCQHPWPKNSRRQAACTEMAMATKGATGRKHQRTSTPGIISGAPGCTRMKIWHCDGIDGASTVYLLTGRSHRAGWPAHADVWPSINALPKETSGNWGINLSTECVHWKAADTSWRDAGGTSTTIFLRFVVSTHLGKRYWIPNHQPILRCFPRESPSFAMQSGWGTNSIQCFGLSLGMPLHTPYSNPIPLKHPTNGPNDA